VGKRPRLDTRCCSRSRCRNGCSEVDGTGSVEVRRTGCVEVGRIVGVDNLWWSLVVDDVLAVGVVVPTGCRIVVVGLCLVLGGAWCLVFGADAVLSGLNPPRLISGWR